MREIILKAARKNQLTTYKTVLLRLKIDLPETL
jgi:hypothetical protein